MRVLQVNKYYPPHIGGIEFHVRDLAEGLRAREDRDIEVEVLCSSESAKASRETIGGIPVRRLPSYGRIRRAPFSPGLPWAMTRARADLLHLHYPSPPAEGALLLPRRTGPVVMTFHADIFGRSPAAIAYSPLLKAGLRRADRIIVTSPVMAERTEVLRPFREKLRIVPLGIDTKRFGETPDVLTRSEVLRESIGDGRVILFVGRFVASKGISILVSAFSRFSDDPGMQDVRLVLVGSGALEASLRAEADGAGLAGRIHFAGTVSDDDLPAYMRMADVFVLPSLTEQEAFGLVQVEAMASGTPVICTDLPTGVPWVNADGVTGRVVPVGDPEAMAGALRDILSDDTMRAEMGAAALERAVGLFDISKMVDGVIDVYDEVIGAHAPGR